MPTTRLPCSNAAETRNALKFAWVPQTRQQISAASKPKFAILYDHVGEILLFNKFLFRLSRDALVAKIKPKKLVRWCIDGHKVNFARGKIPSGGKSSRKCICSVPGQETANIVQSLVDFR